MENQFYTRWMTELDMSQVYEIEYSRFRNSCWTKHDFSQALKEGIGIVAIKGKEVVGFMIYSLHPKKYELLSLATKYSRIGIGTALIDHIRCHLRPSKRIKIQGMVRETNLTAQLFFKSLGFKAVQIKRDTYFDTDEDGYLMQYLLDNCKDVEEEEVCEEENNFS